MARADLGPIMHVTPLASGTASDRRDLLRLSRWHELMLLGGTLALSGQIVGVGVMLVRAGEGALFTTALALTLALTPMIVLVLQMIEVPAAERVAERASSLARSEASRGMPENSRGRIAA